MASIIVNGIVDFVNVLEKSTHDFQVTVTTTNGSVRSFKTCEVFTVGDFISYEIKDGNCIDFANFSNDHMVKFHAAYQGARTLYQRAQDAEQAFVIYDQEDDIRNKCANDKNSINGVSGGITGFLGLPVVIAGVASVNPLMIMAGAGLLGGTACAIKDTADNDAEKKLRSHRLAVKRKEAQEALAKSKSANECLDKLFNRFRSEALQSSVKA